MANSSALDGDTVLREEVEAIHRLDLKDQEGDELYRSLNGLNASALCLSGGGIRSATFGLGVIEALAVHPRPASADGEDKQSAAADKSLLAQFNYLSTVSGGGYIGSWLSAWIMRDGYNSVWHKLIGRREHPDTEPGETSWLRAYSNYLTPKLGLFSADTWTAVALYVRNLMLNWLVILSALILVLLAIKVFTVAGLWSTKVVVDLGRLWVVAFALLGTVLLMCSLRFSLQIGKSSRSRRRAEQAKAETPFGRDLWRRRLTRCRRRERTRFREALALCGARGFVPARALSDHPRAKLTTWSVFELVVVSGLVGVAIYAASWLWAWPPANHRKSATERPTGSVTSTLGRSPARFMAA